MELMEGLLTRRSVRKWQTAPVPAADVREIVKAGMHAPSARNEQAWEFVIDDDKGRLSEISAALMTARMAKDAAFAIVLCVDKSKITCPEYWIQDCSAAMQNMLLACHAKGLGGVWVGIHPKQDREDALRKIYNIPADVPVAALLLGGKPAADLPAADRYREQSIHEGAW